MKQLQSYESFSNGPKKIVLSHKMRRNFVINIGIDRSHRIIDIEYQPNMLVRLPFEVGRTLNKHALEMWACRNNFLVDGKDTCPEEKVMGIKVSDIPEGHPLRHMYPGKFR